MWTVCLHIGMLLDNKAFQWHSFNLLHGAKKAKAGPRNNSFNINLTVENVPTKKPLLPSPQFTSDPSNSKYSASLRTQEGYDVCFSRFLPWNIGLDRVNKDFSCRGSVFGTANS